MFDLETAAPLTALHYAHTVRGAFVRPVTLRTEVLRLGPSWVVSVWCDGAALAIERKPADLADVLFSAGLRGRRIGNAVRALLPSALVPA